MPIYEYYCQSCHESLEAIQKISDKPLRKCPHCKEESLKKKTSLNSFQLKGGGWYRDGYGGAASTAGDSKGASPKKSTNKSEKRSDAA